MQCFYICSQAPSTNYGCHAFFILDEYDSQVLWNGRDKAYFDNAVKETETDPELEVPAYNPDDQLQAFEELRFGLQEIYVDSSFFHMKLSSKTPDMASYLVPLCQGYNNHYERYVLPFYHSN